MDTKKIDKTEMTLKPEEPPKTFQEYIQTMSKSQVLFDLPEEEILEDEKI